MTSDFVAMESLSTEDLHEICTLARLSVRGDELAGWRVGLIFEFPSLRTRASSVAAVQILGGHHFVASGAEVGIDTRECAEDVARTLLATCQIAALRVHSHDVFGRMSQATSGQLGLVNLLSDVEHPTQALADALTLADHFGGGDVDAMNGRTVAYVGDANNVARSLVSVLASLGVTVHVGAPAGYQFDESDVQRLTTNASRGGSVHLFDSAHAAVAGADAIYTDVWVSMGQESDAAARARHLAPFQVNQDLVRAANPDAVVLHCLPAHRGVEIAADVIDSPQSLVWQQVRHRTTAMVGVLRWMKEKRS